MKNRQDQIIGSSPAFLDLLDQISRAAPLDRPMLVIGERGTGKELIAARLHFLSNRWNENYQKLNCAALPDSLLESELFGYEPGAFTGATKRRKGRFEVSDKGSLFLDEIGTMSMSAQEKLLRVIEYGEFERVGGSETQTVDVRVIGATNIDLPSAAAVGAFRHDLLDRLAFDVITVPPLRERKEDIPVLAETFGMQMAREQEWLQFPGYTKGAMDAMLDYHWPGNVRELKNVVERAVYRAWDGEEPIDDIVFDPFASPFRPKGVAAQPLSSPPGYRLPVSKGDTVAVPPAPEAASTGKGHGNGLGQSLSQLPEGDFCLRSMTAEYERTLLGDVLKRNRYNQRQAAKEAGLTYDQFRHALKKHDILSVDPEAQPDV
ncbi:sigma-54-dependent Fis family transcriptional regulator [Kordiimonas sediminis]|uniref:Sigma-54-dependent Fis family transcriptional regulator n=1 Tax=Kordiimonas sediminis TaxID=1735581 RepID=A0A919AML5_9PROT|nr:phage shock protein operon transcriptional activator [Kordiimonas sediminis]GHF16489.1 sigma-54-dependent Fis family transcriptional regulator [Kordiimonas sediminis]